MFNKCLKLIKGLGYASNGHGVGNVYGAAVDDMRPEVTALSTTIDNPAGVLVILPINTAARGGFVQMAGTSVFIPILFGYR